MGNAESLPYFLPELLLIAALLAVLVVDLAATARGRAAGEWPGTVALLGAAAALLWTTGLPGLGIRGLLGQVEGTWLFGRMLVLDGFAVFFKVLLGLALLAVVWMSLGSREVRGQPNEGEYFVLLLASGLAMFLMAAAGNLLMAYLALEFVSLTSYALTGFLPHDRRAGEAALKYLIYGGVASGAMIFGMSWLFGLTGTMDYAGIARGVAGLDPASREALFVALVLVLVGFGYKVAAVPFHMWAPDVYTGAPIPVTAFLAVGSKAAGFAMLLRFFHFGVTATGPDAALGAIPFVPLVAAVSFVTMTLGNLAALSQQNMKRLLAYSSIAHATGREDVDAYRGLAWRPGGAFPAVALAVFLFSLAGLPPLAGFVGKFYVFAAGIQERLYWLVVAALANSVVALYYYARVVKAMFLDAPAAGDPPLGFRFGELSPLGVLSAGTLLLGIRFGWLLDQVASASRLFAG